MTAVSVKVPRVKLIEALQTTLDKELGLPTYEDYQAVSNANVEKYQAALDKWSHVAAKKVLASPDARLRQVYSNQITFYTDGVVLPDKPQPEPLTMLRQDTQKIGSIKNAITLLSLSEEDFVNASTYKSVVQYL